MGGNHLKVVITEHLLPALPILLYQHPTSSLSHTPDCITPLSHPGCGVTSGSLSWPNEWGWVPVSDINATLDPLGSLYYFSEHLPGFLLFPFWDVFASCSLHLPFFPSGGALGPLAVACIVSGDVCACLHGSP